jgi:hypothetical protein
LKNLGIGELNDAGMLEFGLFVCNSALRDNLRRNFVEPLRREGREEVLVGSFRSLKKDSGSEQTKPLRAIGRYSGIPFRKIFMPQWLCVRILVAAMPR